MTHTVHEASAPFADIQSALYQSLERGPLTASMLSQALAAYFPDKSAQELENDCQRMLTGICSGVDCCTHAERMEESDIDQEIADRLNAALKDKTEQEQKQYLIQLFSIFYSKSGNEITPDLAVHIAGMDSSQLFEEVVFLLHQEGHIAGVHLLDAGENHGGLSDEHAHRLTAYADAFTAQEHMWIAAASMYAAGVQEDNPVADPETIGRQVGFLGRFVQIAGNLCARYAAPALAGFACCAGCSLVVNLGVDWMLAGEKALASLAFFSADSIIPSMITSIVGSLGISAVIMLLLSGAALSCMYLVNNALEDLDQHSAALNQKAEKNCHALKATASPSIPEHGYDLQPAHQTSVSHRESFHSS